MTRIAVLSLLTFSCCLISSFYPSLAAKIRLTNDCECGIRTVATTFRIVGGSSANQNEFPWVVGLVSRKYRAPFCGAVLVSDRHLVTAAHCIAGKTVAKYATLADHDYSTVKDGSRFALIHSYNKTIVKHSKYGRDSSTQLPIYDIAVLELAVPINFKVFKKIRPLCLPSPWRSIDSGVGYVAGWGNLKYKGKRSKKLQYANLPIVKSKDCAKPWKVTGLRSHHLCAGGTGKDACQGDSGSALFGLRPASESANKTSVHYELLGITSFGDKCGKIGMPGFYTRASSLIYWLYLEMRKAKKDVTVCKGIFGNWFKQLKG